MTAIAGPEPLLKIDSIVTEFSTITGPLRAVNGASYHVMPGESVGIVGESGSGKSVTVMSLLGLLPSSARVVSGSAWFAGKDLLALRPKQLEPIRGRDIGLIFQDPMTALNPVMTVGKQIAEALRQHHHEMSAKSAMRRTVDLLGEVGIPQPRQRAGQYPHEYSGGMRQRAMIAMAMANRPRLIIADEPTTALDVTIQAQILDLLRSVQQETGAALIFITHDLGVIAEMTNRVVVMYAGRVAETADVDSIFHDSRHPYTRGLLDSLPRLAARSGDLPVIPGQPPNPQYLPEGCSFRTRCGRSAGRPECGVRPELLQVAPRVRVGTNARGPVVATDGGQSESTTTGHLASCHFANEDVLMEAPA
jgi:peptide/nickel transport system ATP-binding protein/oligopeptide transport system ATP-binding protein